MCAEYKRFMKKSRYTHIYQDINRACVPENLDHFTYSWLLYCLNVPTVNIIVFIIGEKLKPSPFKEKESSSPELPQFTTSLPSTHTLPPDALIPVRALPFLECLQRFNGLTNKNASQYGLACWAGRKPPFSKIYRSSLWNSDVKDLKHVPPWNGRMRVLVCAECQALTLGLGNRVWCMLTLPLDKPSQGTLQSRAANSPTPPARPTEPTGPESLLELSTPSSSALEM